MEPVFVLWACPLTGFGLATAWLAAAPDWPLVEAWKEEVLPLRAWPQSVSRGAIALLILVPPFATLVLLRNGPSCPDMFQCIHRQRTVFNILDRLLKLVSAGNAH